MNKIKVRLPFIGGGKERVGASIPLQSFPSVPENDNQRESVIAIWAMGKTPLDAVEDQMIRQFPGLDAQQLNSMVTEVAAKRGRDKKGGC